MGHVCDTLNSVRLLYVHILRKGNAQHVLSTDTGAALARVT